MIGPTTLEKQTKKPNNINDERDTKKKKKV
jgi:hypothetical protein